MRNPAKLLATAASVLVLSSALMSAPVEVEAADAAVIEEGKKIAFDRKKGNCLACHMIAGGDLPGNLGPPLIAMKARFPDKAKLRAQIYDSTKANPSTSMPPFGRHGILTADEIDKVTEFIYTL